MALPLGVVVRPGVSVDQGCHRSGPGPVRAGQIEAGRRALGEGETFSGSWPGIGKSVSRGPGILRIQRMLGCACDPGPTRDPWMDGGNITYGCDGIDAAEKFRADQGTCTIGIAKVHDALPVENCHAR